MVKADAYGHGALPVARALEAAGADGFCVAAYDEAAALRLGRIRAPILVLYPVPPSFGPDAARRRISLSAGEPGLLDGLLAAVAARPGRTALRLQVEVETGLGRGGFRVADLVAVARRIRAARGVRLDGVWTHLQAAEDEVGTARQLERYETALAALRAGGVRLPKRHVAASGALIQGGMVAYDAVRPGLAIYGLVPDELLDRPAATAATRLRAVLSIHARAVRVVDLPTGWGISYGPSFRTSRPSRIATLPLGYGDGWPRSLSNRADALVRGRRVPLVGNVAMDAVMADVTDVPGDPVTTDDEFVLLGRQGSESIDAADLARLRTTNSWETVTSLSRRLPRVYDAGPGPEGVRTLVSGGIG